MLLRLAAAATLSLGPGVVGPAGQEQHNTVVGWMSSQTANVFFGTVGALARS